MPGDHEHEHDQQQKHEHQTDYRFTLANERTFLAWARTSLALLAGGIALDEVSSGFSTSTVRTVLATTAVVLSLVLAVASFVRWRQVQAAMRDGAPLPHPWAIPLLATMLAVVAAGAALAIGF